MKVLDKK
jgi:serine/threonine protein kinase